MPEGRPERYGILLAVMGVLLLTAPPLAEAGHGRLATAIGIPALLAAGAAAVGGRRGLPAGAVVLGALALAADLLTHTARPRALVLASQSLYLAFLVLVAAEILRRMRRAARVTGSTILAGICVYLLIGLAFHGAYALLETLRPESFGGASFADPGARDVRHPELLYFSFVTLTTLGFGDVRPTHALAGMLATLEALVGQLYLAILIASLVGVHLAQRRRD